MTEPTTNYHARAGMYRLLVGYGAMALTNDPKGPSVYRTTLDATLADEHAREIVNYLAATAFGGYIEKCGGDEKAAIALIVRELRAAEDLAGIDEPMTNKGTPKLAWQHAWDYGIETGRYILVGERGGDLHEDAVLEIGPNFDTAPLHTDPRIAAEQQVLDNMLRNQQRQGDDDHDGKAGQ